MARSTKWYAHRELLARLTDNFHPSYERWSIDRNTYHGPWVWYGHDFDPTLPPSVLAGESQVCQVAHDSSDTWPTLRSPDMDISATQTNGSRRPITQDSASMFVPTDPGGRRWTTIQRYSTWDHDNAQRTGMSKHASVTSSFCSSLGLFHSAAARRFLRTSNRRGFPDVGCPTRDVPSTSTSENIVSPDGSLPSPIAMITTSHAGFARPALSHDLPWSNTYGKATRLTARSMNPSTSTCLHPELLGSTRWVGHRAEWAVDGQVIARAIEFPDGENGHQGVLLVDTRMAHHQTPRAQCRHGDWDSQRTPRPSLGR